MSFTVTRPMLLADRALAARVHRVFTLAGLDLLDIRADPHPVVYRNHIVVAVRARDRRGRILPYGRGGWPYRTVIVRNPDPSLARYKLSQTSEALAVVLTLSPPERGYRAAEADPIERGES